MIRTGTKVTWQWGQSRAEGKVAEIFHDTVTRSLQGSQITRHGTQDNPAYLIEQDDGSQVLKLSSEVDRA